MTYEEYTRYRDTKKMNDAEVARRTNIPPSTFSDWKSGRCSPKMDKMAKIADALGYDRTTFLSEVLGVRVENRMPKPGTVMEQTEKDIIWELYENADDYTKELVRRALKYNEEETKQ